MLAPSRETERTSRSRPVSGLLPSESAARARSGSMTREPYAHHRLTFRQKHPDDDCSSLKASPLRLELSGHSLGHPKQHHQSQQEPTERKEDRRAELVRERADQSD